MNEICRTHNVVMLVLDTLRYDVAEAEMASGRTPHFARLLPHGWEKRHSPGNFTYAAHQAFFAGFLPTSIEPRANAIRLFAARFAGSETTGPETKTFDAPDIVTGFRAEGWRTICIGGVGFFNQQTPLGRVLPGLFEESFWEPRFGVTEPNSALHQFEFAAQKLAEPASRLRPTFLFINVSALHQPNCFYLEKAEAPSPERANDSLESHAAALRYVDSQFPVLLNALAHTGRPTFFLVLSDHGTAYGEDGWHGHRVAHPVVWTVPYGEAIVGGQAGGPR
jgi:hypothetical protein